MLKGIAQLGRDSRGAANMFLDQLTKCERRLQEYEGESLETFSDGMMIAVLASSHPPESIRNVGGGRQVQQVEVSGGAPEHPVKHVMAPRRKKANMAFKGAVSWSVMKQEMRVEEVSTFGCAARATTKAAIVRQQRVEVYAVL